MAKAMLKMPEDFLMKVSKLESKTDEILPRVLQSGAGVVEAKVRTNLSAVVGANTKVESRSTGELERALGTSLARQDKDGNWNIKVGSNIIASCSEGYKNLQECLDNVFNVENRIKFSLIW